MIRLLPLLKGAGVWTGNTDTASPPLFKGGQGGLSDTDQRPFPASNARPERPAETSAATPLGTT